MLNHCLSEKKLPFSSFMTTRKGIGPTLIFKEVAHSCATCQDRLGDVLDDLGLVLGRQGGEPFGKTLREETVSGSCLFAQKSHAVKGAPRMLTMDE